ncbi:MAG: hypothetical protein Q9170_006635 [Blastenia crenularia]
MASLTLDPQYPDSYSDCSSSDSSFSHALLTPTSSTGFSAATSRRQSIASDVLSCQESAFDKVPSFSTEGVTTPLETQIPFRLTFQPDNFSSLTRGYETEPSPTGIQHRRRLGSSSTSIGPRFDDPFASQNPYCNTPATSGLNLYSTEASHENDCAPLGSRATYKSSMDWTELFFNSFDQSYDQTDSVRIAEAFSFDPSAKFNVGYDNPGPLTPPAYPDFCTFDGTAGETDCPQTVAPQETFVYPNPSLVPSTPLCQPLEPGFETPAVKSERSFHGLVKDEYFSPSSSPLGDESPAVQQLEPINVRAHPSSRRFRRGGGSRVNKETSARMTSAKYPYLHDKISTSNKTHICTVCDDKRKFDRPEHYKRHIGSLEHINRLKALGDPDAANQDPKCHKCRIDGCKTKVTRSDNLKPHYQKTHFYEYFLKDKNGNRVLDKDGRQIPNKKRNKWVSPEEAERLGLGSWDPREKRGRKHVKSSKAVKAETYVKMEE